MICSVTTRFVVSNSVLTYAPSVQTDWNGVIISPTVTTRSITGYRLVRVLKLGLFIGPVREGAISQFATSYYAIYILLHTVIMGVPSGCKLLMMHWDRRKVRGLGGRKPLSKGYGVVRCESQAMLLSTLVDQSPHFGPIGTYSCSVPRCHQYT